LHFLKSIHSPSTTDEIGNIIQEYEPTILNKITLDEQYISRIRFGFHEVMATGLGRNYMGNVTNPAGKTGTSQSFIDTDNDGKIDTETLTNTFAGYYPADNPIMSIVAISPDISHRYSNSTYNTLVNRRITSQISEKFFDIYK
ncbi:MAG: penicillin-binding transpeptidase domain-containing protein, partial [Bacilli bacterium]|jgi:cell division protein FtsI/penicillin-binding protein 2